MLGPVDHDVADRRIGEQFLERPETEKLVNQHLFERELFAPVKGDLQLGEHFRDDRAEFLGELVLVERGRGLGVDPLEQARQHLFLDPVDRGFKALDLAAALIAARILAGGQAIHCPRLADAIAGRRFLGLGQLFERRKLVAAAGRTRRGARARAALHRLGDAETRTASAAHSTTLAECAHARWSLAD